MLRPSDPVSTAYWRVEIITPEDPADDRCVLLYGQEEEIAGPMTRELAEAWMKHFDGQPKAAATVAAAPAIAEQAPAAKPRKRAPLSRRKRPAAAAGEVVAPAEGPLAAKP